jgi:3',5'-nucleoside bisphosphate phosphatase
VKIDLHIHSTESDGSLTPAQIISRAKQLGIKAVSITDHDTVAGVKSALTLSKREGIGCISGVEVSAAAPPPFDIPGSLHILGYGMDPDHGELGRMLGRLLQARLDRFPQMIEKLKTLHIDISYEAAQSMAGSAPVSRPHIARAMVAAGAVSSVDEAFDRFLANGKPAYVDRYRIPIEEVLSTVSAAGGICVLAHPGLIRMETEQKVEALITRLGQMGMKGVEAYYPEHTAAQVRYFKELAEASGLMVTGGTDFHGAVRPEIELGVGRGDFFVPGQLWEKLMENLPQGAFYAAAPT